LKSVHPIPRHPVERITHRATIRIQLVLDSAVTSGIVAHPFRRLIHLVIFVVRNHDKQLTRHSLGSSLWNEHVLGPAAPAEVELSQLLSSLGPVQVQVAEGPLEGDGHRGLTRGAGDVVLTLLHCKQALRGSYKATVGLTVDGELVQLHEHVLLVAVQPRIAPLVQFGRNEDATSAFPVPVARILDGDLVGEGLVLEVGEADEDRASGLEVHAAGHVHVGLLPERVQSVGGTALHLDLHLGDRDPGEIQLVLGVARQRGLVLLEDVVDIGVPAVEDGVAHRRGGVAHHAERLQVAVVGVVHVRDKDVPHVVHVPVEGAVRREDAGLDHVAQDVDSFVLGQLNFATPLLNPKHKKRKSKRRVETHVGGASLVDGGVDPVTPPLQIVNILLDLVHLSVQILQPLVAHPGGPRPAGDQAVQLGEIRLLDRLFEVVEPGGPLQLVAQPLEIVPGDDLLVHVVEQLASPVLGDDLPRRLERVHQVPVPVVEVDPQVLPEVGQPVLLFQVGRGVVFGDLDRGARALRYHRSLFARLREHLGIDVLVGEGLDERGEVHVLGVGPVQDRHGEGVVEEVGVDAVARVHRHGDEVVHVAHAEEDVDQATRDASVLGDEEREVFVAAQFEDLAERRNRDFFHVDALVGVFAETVGEGHAEGFVLVGEVLVGHRENGFLGALRDEDRLSRPVEQQEDVLLAGHAAPYKNYEETTHEHNSSRVTVLLLKKFSLL
jgi:hypothetical protein